MALACTLVSAENVLRLAQPWALGCAVSDLLRSSTAGPGVLANVCLAQLLVRSARQAHGPRVFNRICAGLAMRFVVGQRRGLRLVCELRLRGW